MKKTLFYLVVPVFTSVLILTGGVLAMAFEIRSPDFDDGARIPVEFTCDGDDISPELVWEGAPPGAAGFALIMDDPDAPGGTFTHWVIYNIPADRGRLKRGIGNRSDPGAGILFGRNDFGRIGYGGPCPPRGHGDHRYFFTLMALDTADLGLPAAAGRGAVEEAVKGHVIGRASFMGVYSRR